MPTTELWLVLLAICAIGVFAFLARLIFRYVWRLHTIERIDEHANTALSIEYGGYFFAVLIVLASVLSPVALSGISPLPMPDAGPGFLWAQAINVAVFGAFGVILLALFGRLGLRYLMRTDVMAAVSAGNNAAGLVACAGHISTAFVIAAVVAGNTRAGDVMISSLFFVVGLLTLWLCTYLFRFITCYDDAQEIANGNIAAAASYAGMMVAIGVIVGHALEGEFVDYPTSFSLYGKAVAAVIVLYPIRQFVVQGILLGGGFRWYGGKLDDAIAHERNVGAGAVEAAAYIASALLAVHLGY